VAIDMAWIAFFFLLRPGEYTAPSEDTHPFRLEDVRLWAGGTPLSLEEASEAELLAATFVGLTFTTQKNAVAGEVIGQGQSGQPLACPVRAVARRVLHLRSIGASATTFLCAYRSNRHTIKQLQSKELTDLLRLACHGLCGAYGFLPSDVCARSLRAAGAMALLSEHVDTDVIRLIGRWRSDEMLRYLHVQCPSLMKGYSALMLRGGNYALIPSSTGAQLPHF
jgi:hypothetical protein